MKVKNMLLLLVISLIALFPNLVKAGYETTMHYCSYTGDGGGWTTYEISSYANTFRNKLDNKSFKNWSVIHGGEEWDENAQSWAMLEATSICAQNLVMVAEKNKAGIYDFHGFTGSEGEVTSWLNSKYSGLSKAYYEIYELQGTAKNIIDRMNYINEKHYMSTGNSSKLECTYNNNQTKVTIFGNYFRAVEELGRSGEAHVCPSYIYQYCDTSNSSYCAYSFFPEEQYLCKDKRFICKKIDVNGIVEIPKTETPSKVEPKKKNVVLYIEKAKEDRPDQLEMVVERNESNEIKTTLTMSGNIKATLVGTDASKIQLNNFVGDNGGSIYSLHCLTYDDFINHRNEKYSYSINFSGGNLDSYKYICALKGEESIVWTTNLTSSYTTYVIRTIDNMELFAGYDRLLALNKFASCTGLEDDELKNCLNAQKTLYDESLKLSKQCKKAFANLTYECKKENDINSCTDNCCACSFINDIIIDYAKAGYFGNRVISGSNSESCDEILGSLGVWLSRIYNILKLAVPAIIVAMGFKDFIQGMSSGKDDALKKAGTNFIKRLVVGAVFVMLPVLVKMILTFAFGGSFSDICIQL